MYNLSTLEILKKKKKLIKRERKERTYAKIKIKKFIAFGKFIAFSSHQM